jgi:hypothetical protein
MGFGSYWDPRDGGRPYEPHLDLRLLYQLGGETDLAGVFLYLKITRGRSASLSKPV